MSRDYLKMSVHEYQDFNSIKKTQEGFVSSFGNAYKDKVNSAHHASDGIGKM